MGPRIDSELIQVWRTVGDEVKDLLKDPYSWIDSSLQKASAIEDWESVAQLTDLLESLKEDE